MSLDLLASSPCLGLFVLSTWHPLRGSRGPLKPRPSLLDMQGLVNLVKAAHSLNHGFAASRMNGRILDNIQVPFEKGHLMC